MGVSVWARTTKLLCTWHIDRAWRANIRSKIQNEEVGALVYHNLRVLLDEKDCDKLRLFAKDCAAAQSIYILKQWSLKNISQSFMYKEKHSGPHATGKNQA